MKSNPIIQKDFVRSDAKEERKEEERKQISFEMSDGGQAEENRIR
jgi:hypothetical protein